MDSFLLLIIIIIVAAVLLTAKLGSPESKGRAGENTVAGIAASVVGKSLYGHVLQNIYVPRKDGSTSEIDVVLVSTKGLFVFESKNYAGYIFGTDNNKNWTVSLYAGKDWLGFKKTEKHQFYNPIWQNKTHINALRNMLDISAPYYSIIVFSNRGELKGISYDSDKAVVLKTNQLKHYLSSARNTYLDVLSESEVDSITASIAQYTAVDKEAKQAHLDNIRKKKVATDTCPWCGGSLVVRTAKKGSNPGKRFYGCSNYPKCKFTKNIE